MREKEIQAIYDDDLPQFLANLGLKENFDNGKIKCEFCGDIITIENFFGIFSNGKTIKFCCKKEKCKVKIYGPH
ncbi:hypothetical protein KKC63_02975 [Patescibacteria group bacterium]|nr:hypothetical protein [Patescibacteria group bacterium]MBU4023228.1 hypothetical protein [Patescibacteria group bacterium]MBU4078138.1 hypothetical protein [Patescibacteria group bacterium]